MVRLKIFRSLQKLSNISHQSKKNGRFVVFLGEIGGFAPLLYKTRFLFWSRK